MLVHMQMPGVCTYPRVRTFHDAGPALYPRATAPPNQDPGSRVDKPPMRDIQKEEGIDKTEVHMSQSCNFGNSKVGRVKAAKE